MECLTTLENEVGSPSLCSTLKYKIVLGFEIPDLDCVWMGWKFRAAELELGAAEIMGLEGRGLH